MKLVIFGAGAMAEICHFYFSSRSDYTVKGFSVDDRYVGKPEFHGLPVVPQSQLADRFPPDDHELFVAIGYADGNRARERKCREAVARGYRLATYIDPSAVVGSERIGANCLVSETVTLQPFSSLGDGVFVRVGSIVGHHSRIGDFAYLAPGIVMSGRCDIGDRAFLGAGAMIRDEITIAADCVVGLGSVVVTDLVRPGVYFGNPARPTGAVAKDAVTPPRNTEAD